MGALPMIQQRDILQEVSKGLEDLAPEGRAEFASIAEKVPFKNEKEYRTKLKALPMIKQRDIIQEVSKGLAPEGRAEFASSVESAKFENEKEYRKQLETLKQTIIEEEEE